MKLIYDPKTQTRTFRKAVVKPIDTEVFGIIKHGINLGYTIEVVSDSPDCLEIRFTEENKHKSTVQIFPGVKTCSCEQYTKKECGMCKHLGVLEYLKQGCHFVSQEETDFARFLNSKTRSFKLLRNTNYMVYDSLEAMAYRIGTGAIQNFSGSYLTYSKMPKYQNVQVPVTLPDPYSIVNGSNTVTLYDYQHDILGKMLSAKRAICSMVMGAGKTYTAIAGIHFLQTENVLIVCPKSIIVQWINEIKKVLNLDALHINAYNASTFVNSLTDQIGVCTYQTLARNVEILGSKKYKLVIADEIQFIRNDESKTWAAFKKLQSEYFWGLSGTVIENRLDDLYNILDVICPHMLPVKWKFDFEFKKLRSVHKAKVLYANEIQNKDKLRKLIENNVFSYDKLDLKPIVPVEYMIPMDKESKLSHDSYMEQANLLISKSLNSPLSFKERAMIQGLLIRARQCCNTMELIDGVERKSDKLTKILALINDVCVVKGEKLVLYSEWTSMLDIVQKNLPKGLKFSRLDGNMTPKRRNQAILDFQNQPDCMIFFASDAGGLGIDGLQIVCNNVAHVELPWNPAKLDQRNGRLHRLMQTRPVNVHYFITRNSIEEKMKTLLADKKAVRMDTLF